MAKEYMLRIITPERDFFSQPVQGIIVTAEDGELGVLADHIPMATSLKAGRVMIHKDSKWQEAFTSEGFLTVLPHETVMLVQYAEWPDEIDVRMAEEAARMAREEMLSKKSRLEYQLSRASLARAMARLKISRDINHR